jgi:hypothetical protein
MSHEPGVARDSSEGAAHTKDAKESPATVTKTLESILSFCRRLIETQICDSLTLLMKAAIQQDILEPFIP